MITIAKENRPSLIIGFDNPNNNLIDTQFV